MKASTSIQGWVAPRACERTNGTGRGAVRSSFPICSSTPRSTTGRAAQITLNCFDELTHFTAHQFFYMVSRNRSTCGVRPYIRSSCNPDADSWVADFLAWWIDPETGLAIPERAGVRRYYVRVAEKTIWADRPEELVKYLPQPEDLPPSIEPPRPISVTFIPATVFK